MKRKGIVILVLLISLVFFLILSLSTHAYIKGVILESRIIVEPDICRRAQIELNKIIITICEDLCGFASARSNGGECYTRSPENESNIYCSCAGDENLTGKQTNARSRKYWESLVERGLNRTIEIFEKQPQTQQSSSERRNSGSEQNGSEQTEAPELSAASLAEMDGSGMIILLLSSLLAILSIRKLRKYNDT